MKALIASEFGYCSLIWMFHSRKLNSRVNKIYQDYSSSFTEVLEKENPKTIDHKNIQLLATELFQVKKALSLPFMNEIFVEIAQHYYDLKKKLMVREIMLKRVYNRTEARTFLGTIILEIVPNCIKENNSLEEFKLKIKLWSPENCPGRLCKRFLSNVGFS